jgi:hypothetical protein
VLLISMTLHVQRFSHFGQHLHAAGIAFDQCSTDPSLAALDLITTSITGPITNM